MSNNINKIEKTLSIIDEVVMKINDIGFMKTLLELNLAFRSTINIETGNYIFREESIASGITINWTLYKYDETSNGEYLKNKKEVYSYYTFDHKNNKKDEVDFIIKDMFCYFDKQKLIEKYIK